MEEENMNAARVGRQQYFLKIELLGSLYSRWQMKNGGSIT